MSPNARRSHAVVRASAIATAALGLALPTVASAKVVSSKVTAPAIDNVLEGNGPDGSGRDLVSPNTFDVQVQTTRNADGADEIGLICEYFGVGPQGVYIRLAQPRAIGADTVTIDARTPHYPCRIRAIPAELIDWDDMGYLPTDLDLSAFEGPRVLGGAFGQDPPDVGNYTLYRGQRLGFGDVVRAPAMLSDPLDPAPLSIATGGGIRRTALINGTRMTVVFRNLGYLGALPFGVTDPDGNGTTPAPEDFGFVVDGKGAAMPFNTSADNPTHVDRSLDPTTGDAVITATTPVESFTFDGDSVQTGPAGVSIKRTYRQHHDGRQFNLRDEFISTDGKPHKIEAGYLQGVATYDIAAGLPGAEPASFRLPWATGDAYVTPEESTVYGPAPTGRTTVWVRPARLPDGLVPGEGAALRATNPGAGTLGQEEGAITFADAPTDIRFLRSGRFIARFIRDIPANGSTVLETTYSQEWALDRLKDLVGDSPPSPGTPPPPADNPPPKISLPAPPPMCDLPFVSLVDIDATGSKRRPRTRLVGVASPTLAGTTVRVRRDGKQVRKAKVGRDGTIRVTVAAPKNVKRRAKARYRLVVGKLRSRALKATRRAIITQQKTLRGGRISVRGKIRAKYWRTSKRSRPRRVSLRIAGQASCDDDGLSVRKVETDSKGRFRVVLKPPTGSAPALVYRMRLVGGKTTTLPVVVGRP
ncbi:MAG: hypothetical protein AB7G37_21345 [Solirubrobacteraceae bacterium]